MQAAFYHGNRSITVGECTPVPPGPGQVQMRVSHCGICGTDVHIYHGNMDHRVKFPQIIGHESSGVIEQVGEGVTGWKAGDRVTVRPLDYCGECPACKNGHSHICMKLKFIGIDSPGAMQGLWTFPAHTLHRLPENLSLEQGALIEPIAVACHDVRMGEVRSGEYAVVLGGGPIGLLVGLVAKSKGARVLVVEPNPYRIQLARKMGLNVVSPGETDLVEMVNNETGGAGADVVFEVSGAGVAVETMTKLPRVRGRMVMVAIHPQPRPVDLFRFFWRELKLVGARVYEPEDFEEAIALAASGTMPLDPVITKVVPLEGLLPGFQEIDAGGDVMKILVRCS
ncbi:MAG: alcohol dehydrogenase catalytic domain-containing protein [Candidatus Solibacter usitatus]|nr:alcohol dehydrogenase catalytic domain-containing protein [Candidatus Solibacter usitatus]